MIDWDIIAKEKIPPLLEALLDPKLHRESAFANLQEEHFFAILKRMQSNLKSQEQKINSIRDRARNESSRKSSEIDKLKGTNQRNLNASRLLRQKLDSVLLELAHSTSSHQTKRIHINQNKSNLSAGVYDEIESIAKIGNVIPPNIVSPCTQISALDSILPHQTTVNSIVPFIVKNGYMWMGWNKSSTTGDTIRVVHGNNAINLALCDGAGGSGAAGKIYSRVLASVISEYIPLSINSCKLLTGKPMSMIMGHSLTHTTTSNQKEYTRLFRDIPYSQAHDLKNTLRHGRSTALNVIIHPNGYFWYSAIGDAQLFVLRLDQNGNYNNLESIYSTKNDSDDTQLIGLGHTSTPNRATEITESLILKKGEILVAMTDHAGEFAHKFKDQFIQYIRQICKPKTSKKELIDIWDSFVAMVDEELETDDDISVAIYMQNETPEKFDIQSIIFDAPNKSYTLDGATYSTYMKEYYWNNHKKGLKRIPKNVASNLSLIRSEFKMLPPHIPNYSIYQRPKGDLFFIVMDHLSDSDYVRLDEAIYKAKTVVEIEYIQEQLIRLKNSIEQSRIYHCDIAPTNIFLHKNNEFPKLVDLNTLYCHGCFPLDIEQGHKGMYGDHCEGFVPSERIHILPFNVLFFTLEIIKSNGENIESFILKNVERSADEVYLLTPELIHEIYMDNVGDKKEIHMQFLLEHYPLTPPSQITKFLNSSTQSAIFDFFKRE
jgi:hypothetical protein